MFDYTLTHEQRQNIADRYNELANEEFQTHAGDPTYGGGVFDLFRWEARIDLLRYGATTIELRAHETKSGRVETLEVYPWQVGWDTLVFGDLETLRDELNNWREGVSPDVRDQCVVKYDDLPTFGGDEPADTSGIFSWDADHVLLDDGDRFFIETRGCHAWNASQRGRE